MQCSEIPNPGKNEDKNVEDDEEEDEKNKEITAQEEEEYGMTIGRKSRRRHRACLGTETTESLWHSTRNKNDKKTDFTKGLF